jgi:hypothetical protein
MDNRPKRRLAIGEEPNVLIPENVRKSVGFALAGGEACGTVVLVYVPGVPEDPKLGGIVLAATAGHIVEATQGTGDLELRFNSKAGGVLDFPADPDRWLVSQEVDLAIGAVDGVRASELDISPVPSSFLLSREQLAEHEVGEGDDVVFSGLFSRFRGTTRNLPIVRFGRVALMPQENDPIPLRIEDDSGYVVFERIFPAYLAEVYSRGGHSGSPAFLVFPPHRKPTEVAGVSGSGHVGIMGLIGLVVAHFDSELRDVDEANSGIAVLTPSWHILDMLEREEIVDSVEKARKEIEARRPAAVPDASRREDDQFTKPDFERALRKVTRKVKPPKKDD